MISGGGLSRAAERMRAAWPKERWEGGRLEEYRRAIRRVADAHGLTDEDLDRAMDEVILGWSGDYPPPPGGMLSLLEKGAGGATAPEDEPFPTGPKNRPDRGPMPPAIGHGLGPDRVDELREAWAAGYGSAYLRSLEDAIRTADGHLAAARLARVSS